jgi:hypothetical protein
MKNLYYFTYKMIWLSVILLFICISVASCYCILNLFYPSICIGSFAELLTALATLGALLVAGVSLCYAKKQYEKHQEEERTKLLCEYNQRYSTDKNVECVIEWMLKTAIMGKDGRIEKVNRYTNTEAPSVHQKEMFMRFFEELHMQISKNKLDKHEVFNLFSYYALVFDKFEEYRLDITDYNNGEWKSFRDFVEQMKRYKHE